MGGSDTSRGMNFQYACAIEFVLEFVTNPSWDVIQLEGGMDIEDILVFDHAGHVLVRAQIKQKNDPYQWQPAEFATVVQAFSLCNDFEETRYQFVYSGSEGPAFVRDIKPIFAKLRAEGVEILNPSEEAKLKKYFAPSTIAFLLKAGRRLDFIKHDTRGSLRDRSLMRIKRICAGKFPGRPSDDFEEQVYDRLFRVVADATEQAEHYARCFTRAQIFEILGIGSDDLRRLRGHGFEAYQIPLRLTLPGSLENFVGRLDILNILKNAVISGPGSGWVAVYGLPGMGKTTLIRALVDEDQVQEYYPDGILWGALGRNSDPLTILGVWAVELGIRKEEIQVLSTIETRAKAIRRVIGMRRMLLIADDIWDVAAALAVSVGGPNCIHLATTRLPAVAQDLAAARAFKLGELDEDECLELLCRLTPLVSRDQSDLSRELIRLVGCLPLAVSLMGKYLRRQGNHPRRLEAAVSRLRDVRERLNISQPQSPLEKHPSIASDLPFSLLTAIQVSVDGLDEHMCQALYSLSVLPPKPNSFTEPLALAVIGTTADVLDVLYDSGLLEVVSPDRYTLHQTISDFGRLHLTNFAAQHRMVEFILEYVESHHTDFDSLDPEVNNIFAAIQYAKDTGGDELYALIVNSSYRFLETRGLYHLIAPHLAQALSAAQRVGENREQRFAFYHLGRTALRLGRYVEAALYFYNTMSIDEQREDIHSYINALGNLVAALMEIDGIEEAEEWIMLGLSLARKLDDPESIVGMLNTAGAVAMKRGDKAAAEKYLLEALQRVSNLSSYTGLSPLLTNLAMTVARHGSYQEAEKHLQAALSEAEAAHHFEYIVLALVNLISINLQQVRFVEAESYLQRVLPLIETTPHVPTAKPLVHCLHAIAKSCQDPERATEYMSTALTLARSTDDGQLVVILLSEIGVAAAMRSNFEYAQKAFEEAFALAISCDLHELSMELLVKLGKTMANQHHYESAERYFMTYLTLARTQGVKHEESVALLLLGHMALALGKLHRARSLFEQSADQALIGGDIDNALLALEEIGRATLARGEHSIARKYWVRALALARQQESFSHISVALIELATVDLIAQRFDAAEEGFREAASFAEKNRLPDLATVGLYNLIRMYLSQGRSEDARSLGAHCFKLLDEVGSTEVADFRRDLAALLGPIS